MIEFAIVIPVLLVLLFGIIEFGWIFNGYITLEAAAKEGARLAIIGASNEEIEEAVTNHAMTFNFVENEEEEEEGIKISIGSRRGDETTVTVSGELPLLIGFFGVTNPYPLEVTAIMTQER